MTDDITYRLNVNSVSQVYSAFLPALIVYSITLKKSMLCEKVWRCSQNAARKFVDNDEFWERADFVADTMLTL